jgi:hypothetical protein
MRAQSLLRPVCPKITCTHQVRGCARTPRRQSPFALDGQDDLRMECDLAEAMGSLCTTLSHDPPPADGRLETECRSPASSSSSARVPLVKTTGCRRQTLDEPCKESTHSVVQQVVSRIFSNVPKWHPQLRACLRVGLLACAARMNHLGHVRACAGIHSCAYLGCGVLVVRAQVLIKIETSEVLVGLVCDGLAPRLAMHARHTAVPFAPR